MWWLANQLGCFHSFKRLLQSCNFQPCRPTRKWWIPSGGAHVWWFAARAMPSRLCVRLVPAGCRPRHCRLRIARARRFGLSQGACCEKSKLTHVHACNNAARGLRNARERELGELAAAIARSDVIFRLHLDNRPLPSPISLPHAQHLEPLHCSGSRSSPPPSIPHWNEHNLRSGGAAEVALSEPRPQQPPSPHSLVRTCPYPSTTPPKNTSSHALLPHTRIHTTPRT